jgi:aryl carrier-like protein
LVAHVISARAAPDTSELRTYLKRSLPDYMIPQVFVLLESLPMTANGKLDREALPAPERQAQVQYVAARTPVEAALAQVWAEVLDLDRVGVHDNFFELGGNSVRSVQVAARARRSGWPVSVRQIFDHQTVADLALICTVSVDSSHIDEPQEERNIHGNTQEAG